MMRSFALALAALLLVAFPALAQNCPPFAYTLTNGTLADANQVMADFDGLLTCSNTVLAPLASPVFTGTVTMPDSATWTATGLNLTGKTVAGGTFSTLNLLGIGMAPVNAIDVAQNQNAHAIAQILNNSTGGSAESDFVATNGTASGTFGIAGTGFTAYGALVPNDTYLYSNNHNLTLMADGTGLITFASGGNNERARLDGSGRFLLGYTADQGGGQSLQVNGIALLSQGLNVGPGGPPTFSSGLNGAFYGNTTLGAVLIGSGSAYDAVLYNKNNAQALGVPTGTTNVAVAGALQMPFPTGNIGAGQGNAITFGGADVESLQVASGGRGAASNLGWDFGLIGTNTYYNATTDTLKRYSTSSGFEDAQAIAFTADHSQSGGNRISFWTGSNADPAERMNITSTGTVNIAGTLNVAGNPVIGSELIFSAQEQQAQGTAGGSAASGSTWTQRVLNTVLVNTISGVALSGNQITGLPAGTYIVTADADIGLPSTAKLRIRDVTDSTTLVIGPNAGGASNGGSMTIPLQGVFTITGTKTVELDYWATTGGNGGAAYSSGEKEVYANLTLHQVN